MQEKTITHGSLFSGSGGFDEAARMNGIKTLWCSEIEPFPLRVLKKNFPEAKQLGDISQIKGTKIEPVDIISGGSPCQDMSIAGNRDGLDGERSVLFHQQIRIVKEMREKTNGQYPRYMLWENVPGAFSSNKGEDFRSVLQAIASITGEEISIPRPPRGGQWSYAGAIMGRTYSIAWRTMDAQYWGVPQRRRRIYLVADFGGASAPQVLFERESLSWNPTQSRIERQAAAGDFEESIGISSRGGYAVENHPNDSRVGLSEDGKVQTLTGRMGTGGGNVPLVMEELKPYTCGNGQVAGLKLSEVAGTLDCKGGNPTCNQGGMAIVAFEPGAASRVGGHVYEDGKSGTLRANAGDNQQAVAIPIEGNGQRPSHKGDGYNETDKMYTLNATEQHAVAYGIDRAAFNQGQNAQFGIAIEEEVEPTMVAKGPNAVAQPMPEIEYIVRRLTPMECARLQGFDDDWTDDLIIENPDKNTLQFFMDAWLEHWAVIGRGKGIKKPKTEKEVIRWLSKEPSDSDKYKLWGNGIALPCAFHVFEGIIQILGGEPTA